MVQSDIDNLLRRRPELAEKLYCRGFLLTNDKDCEKALPILKQWKRSSVGGLELHVHPKLPFTILDDLCLIGHAYDPVDMRSDEREILQALRETPDFYGAVNHLTGVFTLVRVENNGALVLGDATGMQTCF